MCQPDRHEIDFLRRAETIAAIESAAIFSGWQAWVASEQSRIANKSLLAFLLNRGEGHALLDREMGKISKAGLKLTPFWNATGFAN